MKAIAMCFSLLQLPQCRVNLLANSWSGKIYRLDRNRVGASSHSRLYCSNRYELEGGQRRRYTRRTISTETGGSNDKLKSKTSQSSAYKLESTEIPTNKAVGIRKKKDSENAGVKLSSSILETAETVSDQHCVDLAKHATIICFDIETTGFSREHDRIIEIAFQDLQGGDNSTFQSLVNPGCSVPNKHIHGISTDMVNRSDVPRMKELVPILLQYVRSRQIPGGIVVLVSHNGRTFDVPFLKREFSRCSYEIPEDWYFVDTVPLARKAMKIIYGPKPSPKTSLQALREHYNIPLMGTAHRALSDVHSLALVLQRLTYDLKLPISGLIQKSFRIKTSVNFI